MNKTLDDGLNKKANGRQINKPIERRNPRKNLHESVIH